MRSLLVRTSRSLRGSPRLLQAPLVLRAEALASTEPLRCLAASNANALSFLGNEVTSDPRPAYLPPPARSTTPLFPVRSIEPTTAIRVRLPEGQIVLIRSARECDAEREQEFVRNLSPESRHMRFMFAINELPPDVLRRMTHPDPMLEVSLVATVDGRDDGPLIAHAMCSYSPNRGVAEFAVAVADEYRCRGLGRHLMRALADAAHEHSWPALEGFILTANTRMLDLMNALGYHVSRDPEDPSVSRAVKHIE